jgi:hypothetical protein
MAGKAARKIPKRGKIDIKYANPEVRQALRHRALLRHEGSSQLRKGIRKVGKK